VALNPAMIPDGIDRSHICICYFRKLLCKIRLWKPRQSQNCAAGCPAVTERLAESGKGCFSLPGSAWGGDVPRGRNLQVGATAEGAAAFVTGLEASANPTWVPALSL
jgi:hypothetical protein